MMWERDFSLSLSLWSITYETSSDLEETTWQGPANARYSNDANNGSDLWKISAQLNCLRSSNHHCCCSLMVHLRCLAFLIDFALVDFYSVRVKDKPCSITAREAEQQVASVDWKNSRFDHDQMNFVKDDFIQLSICIISPSHNCDVVVMNNILFDSSHETFISFVLPFPFQEGEQSTDPRRRRREKKEEERGRAG